MTTAYAYSGGLPRTVTVTAGAEQQVVRNIAFAPFGGRTRAEFPPYDSGSGLNTVISTRSYNLRGQVAALQVTSPAGTVLDQSFDYAYTAGGAGPVDAGPNLDRLIDNRDPGESRFYFYDDLDRLWKSTSLAGAPLSTYAYDANGNRTEEIAPAGTTTYAYEAATDRLAQASGAGAQHYAHDAYGSRIWTGPSAYAGLPSHVYNELNRLVEVRDPATQAVLGQYTYDAFGRRVRKVTASGTTLFFYDSAGHLVEERSLATTPDSTRDYVWLEDEPIGVVDQGPQPTRFSWIHSDRLGTPLAVSSSPASGSAQVLWRASYAPFGEATVNEDPDGDLQAFTLDLRFPGQFYDAESGAHYNLFRFYDPHTGRYAESDPIALRETLATRPGMGPNVFGYAFESPLNFFDPSGLEYRPPGTVGHGDVSNPRSRGITGWIVDLPNGKAKGSNEDPIPSDADVDFICVNKQWWKIKHGTVSVDPRPDGGWSVNPASPAAWTYPARSQLRVLTALERALGRQTPPEYLERFKNVKCECDQ